MYQFFCRHRHGVFHADDDRQDRQSVSLPPIPERQGSQTNLLNSPLLVAGALIQTASLMTMGGLGTVENPSHSVRTGIVVTVTLFTFGFSLGWAPLSHVVAAEIPTTGLRDLTYALGSVFNIVIQWAVAFSIPYLIDKSHAGLGSKVGFIFGTTAFMATLFSWFCIPECGGKTLEEIDDLFVRGVPISKFRTAKLGSDLEGSENVEVFKANASDISTTEKARDQ